MKTLFAAMAALLAMAAAPALANASCDLPGPAVRRTETGLGQSAVRDSLGMTTVVVSKWRGKS